MKNSNSIKEGQVSPWQVQDAQNFIKDNHHNPSQKSERNQNSFTVRSVDTNIISTAALKSSTHLPDFRRERDTNKTNNKTVVYSSMGNQENFSESFNRMQSLKTIQIKRFKPNQRNFEQTIQSPYETPPSLPQREVFVSSSNKSNCNPIMKRESKFKQNKTCQQVLKCCESVRNRKEGSINFSQLSQQKKQTENKIILLPLLNRYEKQKKIPKSFLMQAINFEKRYSSEAEDTRFQYQRLLKKKKGGLDFACSPGGIKKYNLFR